MTCAEPISASECVQHAPASKRARNRLAWLRRVEAANVSPGARLVAGYITRLRSFPEAYFSLAQLKAITGRGPVQNRRYLRELEAAGLLEREKHIDPKYGQKANDYLAVLPDGMIGGAISEERALVNSETTKPQQHERAAARPAAEPRKAPPAPRPPRPPPPRPVLAPALPLPPAVEAEPLVLRRLEREHGAHAPAMVRAVLASSEVRQRPDAAPRALALLGTYRRSEVKKDVGALLTWIFRELLAGREQMGSLVEPPAVLRIDREIETCEQTQRFDDAAKLRALKHELGRQAAAERDAELLRTDPNHRRVQAAIDATLGGGVRLPLGYAPQPRELKPAAPVNDRFLARVLAPVLLSGGD